MNRVEALKVPESEATHYPLGTMIQVEDDRGGMVGGIYMLASAGDDRAAVLVNLAHGSSRNGQLSQESQFCGVTLKELRDNLGWHVKFHVVKSIKVTGED